MVTKFRAYPLVMYFIKRSRLQWHWVVVVVAVVLLLFLVLAAYLDGVLTELSEWSLWQYFVDGPVLTIYIMVVYPFLWRLWWRSVQSLRSLLPIDKSDSDHVEMEVPIPNRRWEWLAILMGAIFWLSLWQPWGRNWGPGELRWLSAYDVVTQTILFSLLSWLVYNSFVDSRYQRRLSGQLLNFEIFNTELFIPVARSSLGVSLAFIGGISLSLVFQTREDLLMWNNITVWAILVCFAVLSFFLSMWSTHTAMANAKRRELSLARQHLVMASHRLKNQAVQDKPRVMQEISSTITAWVNYERRVQEVPEWPFNAVMVRRLAASTLVPAVVFLIKVLSRLGFSF
ncbi:hypothetical protein ACFLWD_03095 [Chloroflexota bacterium]